DIDDALEASRGPDGSGGGDEQRDEQSDRRAPNQTATNFRLNRFDIREGIGETDCASGNWSGDIEEWNADGSAAALVFTRPSSEGGDEFLASGVILHGRGIAFGIGENFSGGVDDSGAGSGGETFLRCDFRERSTVDFDSMGEEESLLREVAFDLGAQRSFPCATDHDVEGGSGSGDDDEENGKELEEDAVLHVLLVGGSGNARGEIKRRSIPPPCRIRHSKGGAPSWWRSCDGRLIWGTRSGIRRRARFSGNAGFRGQAQFFRGCGGRKRRRSVE